MVEDSKERRKRLDHERYMRNREERLVKQRIYYREHRNQYVQWRKQRMEREKQKLFKYAILHEEE